MARTCPASRRTSGFVIGISFALTPGGSPVDVASRDPLVRRCSDTADVVPVPPPAGVSTLLVDIVSAECRPTERVGVIGNGMLAASRPSDGKVGHAPGNASSDVGDGSDGKNDETLGGPSNASVGRGDATGVGTSCTGDGIPLWIALAPVDNERCSNGTIAVPFPFPFP